MDPKVVSEAEGGEVSELAPALGTEGGRGEGRVVVAQGGGRGGAAPKKVEKGVEPAAAAVAAVAAAVAAAAVVVGGGVEGLQDRAEGEGHAKEEDDGFLGGLLGATEQGDGIGNQPMEGSGRQAADLFHHIG